MNKVRLLVPQSIDAIDSDMSQLWFAQRLCLYLWKSEHGMPWFGSLPYWHCRALYNSKTLDVVVVRGEGPLKLVLMRCKFSLLDTYVAPVTSHNPSSME